MNRRKFLKMLGIIPLAPLVIKGLNIEKEKDEFHPYSRCWSVRRPYPKLTHRYSKGKVEKYKPDKSDKDAWLL